MQICCENCGEELQTPRKFGTKRREMIRAPKSYRIIICTTCGKKNLVKV